MLKIGLIKEGKIVTYLNTESNDDLPKYQDADEFEKIVGMPKAKPAFATTSVKTRK